MALQRVGSDIGSPIRDGVLETHITTAVDYTVADGVSTVNVNAASATITLPAATLVGRRVTVRKISASAGTVTISRAGADTIQGLASIAIDAQNASVSLEVSAVGTWAYVSTSGQGIYLGGTAAANLLDDYEEGTWTPTVVSTTSGTIPTTASGWYTKLGNVVSINAVITIGTPASPVGLFKIDGIPFPYSARFAISVYSLNAFTGSAGSMIYGSDDGGALGAGASMYVFGYDSTTGDRITFIAPEARASGVLQISASYQTIT